MRILNLSIYAAVMTSLILSGCTGEAQFKSWRETLLSPAYWHRLTPEQQAKASRREIKHALSLNDFEQAQKHLVVARQQNIADAQLKEFYPPVINRLLVLAKEAKDANDPAQAGRFFILAKEIYPSTNQAGSTIELSIDSIDVQLKSCADDLMKAGLSAYRSGNLGIAIDAWAEIESFSPEHKPSQIAIRTAQRQLQNLKNITSKNIKQQ